MSYAIVEIPLRPISMRMDRDLNTKRLTFEMVIDFGKHPLLESLCQMNQLYDSWIPETDFAVVVNDSDRAKILFGPRINSVDFRGGGMFRITGTCDSTSIVPTAGIVEQNTKTVREHEKTDSVTKQKIYDTFEYPIRCGGLSYQKADGYSDKNFTFSIRLLSNYAPRFFEFLRHNKPATYSLNEIDVELMHDPEVCAHFSHVVITRFTADCVGGDRYDATIEGYAEKFWSGPPLGSQRKRPSGGKVYSSGVRARERQRMSNEIHDRISAATATPPDLLLPRKEPNIDPRSGYMMGYKEYTPDDVEHLGNDATEYVPDVGGKAWPWIATGSRGPLGAEQVEPFDRPVVIRVNKIVTTGTGNYGITGAATKITEISVHSFEELRALIEYANMSQPAVIGMIVGFPEDPMWQFMRYLYRRMMVTKTDRRY